MIDDNMNNILKNFAGAGQAGTDKKMITDAVTGKPKINSARAEKDAMKTLLEGLDAQQKSVNQMPANRKMGKNTKAKHPASNYLVGGEEGDVPAGEEQLDEDDIEEQLSPKQVPKQAMNKKQSLNDIFKSMDETSEDLETRFKRELHDEIQNKELKKGGNGKYDLAEEWPADVPEELTRAIVEIKYTAKRIQHFAEKTEYIEEEFSMNNGETFVKLAKELIQAVNAVRAQKR